MGNKELQPAASQYSLFLHDRIFLLYIHNKAENILISLRIDNKFSVFFLSVSFPILYSISF